MRRSLSLLFLTALVCVMQSSAQDAEKLAAAWEKEHITVIQPSDVRHADLKKYLEKLSGLGVPVKEVGRSNAGREIYQTQWGKGPIKVFMWSQMHGDEPTATSALMDMFAYLQKHANNGWISELSRKVTIRAVPMLNPDGAEIYQRRNLQDIDINRDAVDLKTPEARLLKQLRDEWMPEIGFNLHNQGALTTAGTGGRQAAISLLAVWGDEEKTLTAGQDRNQRLISAIVKAIQRFIPGNIGKYSDEWTPTAFGDNFSAWGTPTILIETGALNGKDELYLVKINFIALLTALHTLATGTEKNHDPSLYLSLPQNSSGLLANYVFRSANLVRIGTAVEISSCDISANTQRRRASFVAPVLIRAVAPTLPTRGLVEYDASGFNVIQRFGRAEQGELAELLFYKRDRQVDWIAPDLMTTAPPDAIFSGGKWIKGDALVPRR
jgi:hypothetical protein